jgi:hypothetical protein
MLREEIESQRIRPPLLVGRAALGVMERALGFFELGVHRAISVCKVVQTLRPANRGVNSLV